MTVRELRSRPWGSVFRATVRKATTCRRAGNARGPGGRGSLVFCPSSLSRFSSAAVLRIGIWSGVQRKRLPIRCKHGGNIRRVIFPCRILPGGTRIGSRNIHGSKTKCSLICASALPKRFHPDFAARMCLRTPAGAARFGRRNSGSPTGSFCYTRRSTTAASSLGCSQADRDYRRTTWDERLFAGV